MLNRKMKRSVVGLCVALTLMLGMAHAAPQPFSQGEQRALTAQASGSQGVGTLQCGMSDGAKTGIAVGLAVVALVLAVGMLASVASSSK